MKAVILCTLIVMLGLSVNANATMYKAELLPERVISAGKIVDGEIPVTVWSEDWQFKQAGVWKDGELNVFGSGDMDTGATCISNLYIGGNANSGYGETATSWSWIKDRKSGRVINLPEDSIVLAFDGKTAVGEVFVDNMYAPAQWKIQGNHAKLDFVVERGRLSDIDDGKSCGEYWSGKPGDPWFYVFTTERRKTEVLSPFGMNAFAFGICGDRVVGLSQSPSQAYRATIFQSGANPIVLPGGDGSGAIDLNNESIVGWLEVGYDRFSVQYGAIWQEEDYGWDFQLLQDLLFEPGWRITQANSVDASGNIVCLGSDPTGKEGIILLSPM